MKTKIFEQNENGSFNWSLIMKKAIGYRYVVMLHSYASGNSKGEYFKVSDFERLFKEQSFWFNNEDRPVWNVILTDDDVPGIIEQRRSLIDMVTRTELDMRKIVIPQHPDCDGRATRRTQPEAFAKWDLDKAEAESKMTAMLSEIESLRRALYAVKPAYSTTLYNISK